MNLKKNDIINLNITGMTSEGNGVGKTDDGMAVFVPLTAVGDIISCRIVKLNKTYCFGIIDSIITPSSDRIKSDCIVSEKCGGCTFRHISYSAELKIKAQLVKDAFERIGGFSDIKYTEICGAVDINHYRNKAQYPVAMQDGKAVCGFYSKRSHRVVPFTKCALQSDIFAEIVDFSIEYVNENKILAYKEENGSGILRHIYLRRGFHSGEIMVCFVVTSKKAQKLFSPLADKLMLTFKDIKSVILNINSKNTNVILGEKNIIIKGNEHISDTLCGNKIGLSPMSFYQVNTVQAERLYSYAKECADLSGDETLLDLYCGAGTIGLSFADSVKKVIGGEIIPEAIENAIQNAMDNNITNVEFICGDAGVIADGLVRKNILPDVVVIDPPRKGCDTLTLESIVKMAPSRVVMISCNPATAARDAKFFCENGYEVKSVRGFDLFPRTGHVETVVLMSRAEK